MVRSATAASSFADYLTIGEAAEFLGVSPQTLRNWDRAGRLKSLRHPHNSYRIYRQQDLEAVLRIGPAPDSSSAVSDRLDFSNVGDREHFVQFYEDDAFLMDSVADYVATGLNSGSVAVIIVTPSHRQGIERKLQNRGIDLSALTSDGRYLALDAADALSQFMVEDRPDPALFHALIGGVIRRAALHGRKIRAFGEMVALLWHGGNTAGAIRLEELWNELAEDHEFSLFCAYPLAEFDGESDGPRLSDVCTCHTRVIPAESYAALPSADQRLREITRLQQKAAALEAEIAQHRKTEAALLEAKALAERASRAKDQFLAVLSHELRTPLTPVLMATAAMEAEPGLPPRVREDLGMIRRNIALETRLIDDLLDVSRVINGKMSLHKQDLDLHALIRDVVEMVRADANTKRLAMELGLDAPHVCVHGDGARLHQVLWNVLKNAIKFTPDQGRIDVRTRAGTADRIVVEIRDTGAGIDPDSLPDIFNAFDQGQLGMDRTFGGLGLGLAISKAVVELHTGTIAAHSDGPGLGACFTIELPVRPQRRPSRQALPASIEHKAAECERPCILLVEDHPDTVRVMKRLLESSGYSVQTAGTVAEAVRLAVAGQFDLIVSDMGLPDGTGIDMLRQVRATQSAQRAIALTGFGMEQDVRNCHDAGFAAHLTKPVDMETLEKTILKVISSDCAVIR